MIFLLFDLILSFGGINSYLILLNLLVIPKKETGKLILILLCLDLLVVNSYFINTIFLTFIFLLFKKFKIVNLNFKNYLIILSLIFFIYVGIIGFKNNYASFNLLRFIGKNYLINLPLYILSYKIILKNIKLAR